MVVSLKACKCAGFFLIIFYLGGCAFFLPQSQAISKKPPIDLPSKVELTDVPFFAQEKYQCGPAALAMALNAAGLKVKPDSLVNQVYIPAKKGSLQIEMLSATRRHGLVAYELAPQLTEVLREIAAGTPVIVLENYSYGVSPVWHYSIAIGYDLNQGIIIRRSGIHAYESMPFGAFEYLWKSDRHWAMVALPPEKMPATANESKYAEAVSALENSGHVKNAQIAYKTLLKRWPDNLVGQIGLGNTSYELKDLEGAESAFTGASTSHPDSVAAFNNLAHILFELGKKDAALKAAEHAVSLGGPLKNISEITLNEIQEKILMPNLKSN